MELDKRIKAITDIQSVTSGCQDWRYTGVMGYFANRITDFEDLEYKCVYGEYAEYREHDKCFQCLIISPDNKYDYTWYSYFISKDALNPVEPEKKYRPYTLETWEKDFNFGDILYIREKPDPEREKYTYKGIYTGWRQNSNNKTLIAIGSFLFTFEEFFKYYEIFKNDVWQPFGVEE